MEKIRPDLLQVGAPVPFDVYDSTGRLLLRRGHSIDNDAQLERLTRSGFCDAEEARAHRARSAQSGRVVAEFSRLPSQLARHRISIFEQLNETAHALEGLRTLTPPAPGFEAGVRAAAAAIRAACALDSDAALAHIMLCPPLTYSLRHSCNAAILTSLLLNRLHHEAQASEAAVAAALTMNLASFDLQNMLSRQQEPLTPEQREAVRIHPSESARMLRNLGVEDPVWLQAVEQHHEARDGSGYPAGLKDAAICREAQIVSLADRYCALVSNRTYRPALAPRRAIKELHERAGSAIEPALIAHLIAAVGLFPPGAYVRLANGETAIVVRRLLDPKHPTVFALHQDTTAPYETPKKRLTGSHRDFEIVGDVKSEAVRVKVEPDKLWPPSAAGDDAAVV